MKDENKKVIEINGIKMGIDLRKAKVIDEYKFTPPHITVFVFYICDSIFVV